MKMRHGIAALWLAAVMILLALLVNQPSAGFFVYFLVLTFPFGFIWFFGIYEWLVTWLPPNLVGYLGYPISIAAAFLFWFVLLPKLRRRRRS